MPSSAQMTLSADKSSATPARASLSERNYSERALRTYLQQSPAHSSLEPLLQSLLTPSKSARTMRHESSTPFHTGALPISLCEGAAAPSSFADYPVMRKLIFFCLLSAPSTAVKVPGLSPGGLKQRIRQREWDKETNLCLSGPLLSRSEGSQLNTRGRSRKSHLCCVSYRSERHRSLNCRSGSVCMPACECRKQAELYNIDKRKSEVTA